MIFVIGGAYQGKTAFVMEHLKIEKQDMLDGESCSYEAIYDAKVIHHFERFIYRLMKEEKPVFSFVQSLLEENKNLCIIMTEIGNGLVPIDSFERNYRETVGRVGCLIVKYAAEVYRVQVAIPTKIYENPNKKRKQIKVYLVRHSITKGNLEKRFIGTTDEALCKEGVDLAKTKKLPPVEQVYSSPLTRCTQTADILYPNHKKVIMAGLRETDFGEFEYKNHEELDGNVAYQQWIDSNATTAFPNGESLEDVKIRAKDAFCHIIKDALQKQYESIAIVTHGGTIMAIMSQFSNEKRDYFEWRANNCEGYLLEIDGGSACYQ